MHVLTKNKTKDEPSQHSQSADQEVLSFYLRPTYHNIGRTSKSNHFALLELIDTMGNSASNTLPPLQHTAHCLTDRFMGTWFVIGVKPTMFEKTCSNAVEIYTRMPKKKFDVDIDFQYNAKEPIKSPLKALPQKGWIQGEDKNDSGLWKVSPLWPIKMPYLILEVDEKEYSYTVIGYPNREYCWIMYRHPQMPDSLYDELKTRLVEKHQYNLDGLRKVPQVWTKEEREKRNLSAKEIPDSMLTTSPN